MIIKGEKIKEKEPNDWYKAFCFIPRIGLSERGNVYMFCREPIWRKRKTKEGCSDRICGGFFTFIKFKSILKQYQITTIIN
jgi:hypothetical protein